MKSRAQNSGLHPGQRLRGFSGLLSCSSCICAFVRALWLRGLRARQGGASIEFALVIIPFCMMIIFIFAIGMHFFYQELLDSALHVAVRKVQTGVAQNIPNGNTFIADYLYPATGNMLTCSNLYVNVQQINFAGTNDFYNYTTGALPNSNGALSLANFAGTNAFSSGTSEFILVTAIYLAPSFTGTFLPNVFSLSYNGSQVDAIMSQVATYTENYTVLAAAVAPAVCP